MLRFVENYILIKKQELLKTFLKRKYTKMNKILSRVVLINFIAVLVFSCNFNEVNSQSLEGKWLGNIYDYELKKHCAIEFRQDKVYLYGFDLVTIVDSIKREANYLITSHEYKGKIKPINEQLTCIENLPQNQDSGKCDMFYKVQKTLVNCNSMTLKKIIDKSSPLYLRVDNNEEFVLSKTLDPDLLSLNDEIEELNLFKVDETYFLIPADYHEDSILMPIKEINNNYLLVFHFDERMEIKFHIK